MNKEQAANLKVNMVVMVKGEDEKHVVVEIKQAGKEFKVTLENGKTFKHKDLVYTGEYAEEQIVGAAGGRGRKYNPVTPFKRDTVFTQEEYDSLKYYNKEGVAEGHAVVQIGNEEKYVYLTVGSKDAVIANVGSLYRAKKRFEAM